MLVSTCEVWNKLKISGCDVDTGPTLVIITSAGLTGERGLDALELLLLDPRGALSVLVALDGLTTALVPSFGSSRGNNGATTLLSGIWDS